MSKRTYTILTFKYLQIKITQEPIPYTCQESKRIFENELSVKEGAENIHTKCGIKFTSSKDYIHYFKYLKTGTGSCRILSKFSQEYYLEMIKKDYGKEQLEQSLQAFYKLIEKFEPPDGSTKKSVRYIYGKFRLLMSVD